MKGQARGGRPDEEPRRACRAAARRGQVDNDGAKSSRLGVALYDPSAGEEPERPPAKGWPITRSFLKDTDRDVVPTDDFFDVGFHIYYRIDGERLVVDALEAFEPADLTLDGFPLFKKPYAVVRDFLRGLKQVGYSHDIRIGAWMSRDCVCSDEYRHAHTPHSGRNCARVHRRCSETPESRRHHDKSAVSPCRLERPEVRLKTLLRCPRPMQAREGRARHPSIDLARVDRDAEPGWRAKSAGKTGARKTSATSGGHVPAGRAAGGFSRARLASRSDGSCRASAIDDRVGRSALARLDVAPRE